MTDQNTIRKKKKEKRKELRRGSKPSNEPRVEVNLTFLAAQPLRDALDANLPLHLPPEEGQRRLRVAGDVLRLFGRAPIGVYDEARVVEFLEVHHARAHAARGEVAGRQCRGLRLVDRRLRRDEPGVELCEGV